MEDNYWTTQCKRCGIGTNTDYCHDCHVQGYDPSSISYKYKNESTLDIKKAYEFFDKSNYICGVIRNNKND